MKAPLHQDTVFNCVITFWTDRLSQAYSKLPRYWFQRRISFPIRMNYKQPFSVWIPLCVCMKQHMQLKTVLKSYLNKMSHVDILNPRLWNDIFWCCTLAGSIKKHCHWFSNSNIAAVCEESSYQAPSTCHVSREEKLAGGPEGEGWMRRGVPLQNGKGSW